MQNQFNNTVLVVDDEEAFREVLVAVLKKVASTVMEAENGLDALEIIRSEKIDLVLLDINMPEMDGLTLLKEIRKTYPTTTCVIISAYCDHNAISTALRYGAYDFLEKPIEGDQLRNCISRALQKVRYEKIQNEMLELLLYKYGQSDPREFEKLPIDEREKVLQGILGVMRVKLINLQKK